MFRGSETLSHFSSVSILQEESCVPTPTPTPTPSRQNRGPEGEGAKKVHRTICGRPAWSLGSAAQPYIRKHVPGGDCSDFGWESKLF